MRNLRYNKKFRRFLIWIHSHIKSEKWQEKIADYLYPDDATITFL